MPGATRMPRCAGASGSGNSSLPRPIPTAVPPNKKNGTSLPNCSPMALNFGRSSARPTSAGSANSTAAASLGAHGDPLGEPHFDSPRGAHRLHHQPRRADYQVIGDLEIVLQRDRGLARRREGDLQRVGERDRLEHGAQFVETIGPLAEHAQIEIDFGQRAHPRPARRTHLSYSSSEKTSCPLNRPRPPRKVNSTTKPIPTTTPPASSTIRAAAAAVPPVASRSSTISTRSPLRTESLCISSVSVPYSRS